MNALIIDDEILNIKNLEIILSENFNQIKVLGGYTNVTEAEEFINKNEIDLIFLDINMPFQDGFDLLDLFPERSFEVVFVTAYEEFALKALKSGATDYILKPILVSELKEAIEKVEKKYKEKLKLQSIEDKELNDKIMLSYTGGKTFVNPEDIIYIQGIDNLSKVFLKENKRVFVSKTLKYFEELLDSEAFFRTHKSYLVNISCCEKIHSKGKYLVELTNKVKVPVSTRKYKPLMDVLSKSVNV